MIVETPYGRIQTDENGRAIAGSVFRFVDFRGAGGLQVEILSGSAQGMCRLVGSPEAARVALTELGLAELTLDGGEDPYPSDVE